MKLIMAVTAGGREVYTQTRWLPLIHPRPPLLLCRRRNHFEKSPTLFQELPRASGELIPRCFPLLVMAGKPWTDFEMREFVADT
jgi:hypothetical protein